MNPHVEEHLLAEWVLTGNQDAEAHLQVCPACRTLAETLRSGIVAHRQWTDAKVEHDDAFWIRQQLQIQRGINRSRPAAFLWQPLAAIVAILVLCAALLLTRSHRPAPVIETTTARNTDAADNVLLEEVEDDVSQDYPAALAPIVLLSQERSGRQSDAR